MRKKRTTHIEPKNEISPPDTENSIESIKYIKRLEIQRRVMNKIVNTDLSLSTTNSVNPDSLDSN
jgi:hypothetical protein